MLSETEGFVPLPGEQRLYTSPPRTTLSLQTLNKYPGKEPFSIQSSSGCVYLTNRRVGLSHHSLRLRLDQLTDVHKIVYLPASPTPQLQSFAAPVLNLHDTHVTAPFFGPNVWTALLQPVAGGGIPPQHAALELKMTFKEGGAFDFHSKFERIKERLQQAVEVARESGLVTGDGSETGGGRGPGGLGGVDIGAVHLDELPAYSESGMSVPQQSSTTTNQPPRTPPEPSGQSSPHEATFSPPAEPPPGYEEVQRDSVAEEVERRLRDAP